MCFRIGKKLLHIFEIVVLSVSKSKPNIYYASMSAFIPLGYLVFFLFYQASYKSEPPSGQLDGGGGNTIGVCRMNKYNPNSEQIKIGGKLVAVLRDGSLLDIRKHSDHFLYLKNDYNGGLEKTVCIATETLRQARHANIIQVTDTENKVKYTISRTDFDKRSFDFEGSRAAGFEEQRACYLRYFASNEPKRINYTVHIEAEPLPQIEQMSLFG